jgi:hypothetical protein
MTSRKDIFNKYYVSDIFNRNPEFGNKEVKPKVRLNHSSLDITKEDVFNIGKEKRIQRGLYKNKNEPNDKGLTQGAIKRKKDLLKIYGSDIFNSRKSSSVERRRCKQHIDSNIHKSSLFNDPRNNEEYSNELKIYSKEHRGEKKEYDPDKYIETVTPQERYYRHIYENHAEGILPGTYLKSEGNIDESKLNYIKKKINLHKNERLFNDVGVDKKRKEGQNPLQELRYIKRHPLTTYNADRRRFVDLDEHPINNCRINKQIQFESHIFTNDKNNYTKTNKEIEEINERIEKERNKHYNLNVLGQPYIRVTLNKKIYNPKQIKLRPANISWNSPKAEVMFGRDHSHDIYQIYGPRGPNAYQLKCYQFADSGNLDTLSGMEKTNYHSTERPKKDREINDENSQKIGAIVNNLPNLNEGQKLKVKNKISVMDCATDDEWDSKAKTLTDFYKKKGHNHRAKNKEITEKVNNINKKTDDNRDHGYHNYVITYANKGNQFEKFDDRDIKNIFGAKGLTVCDIHKNPFPKGNYNNISFKIIGKDNTISQKVKLVEDDLKKKNYKINIEKGAVKNNKKSTNRIMSNPGGKVGIMPDYPDKRDNKFKLKVMPNDYKKRKGFTKEFAGINYAYKKPMQ